MNSIWRYRDIIDFEYFLNQDNGRTSPEELLAIQERDRQIYQDRIKPAVGEQKQPDRHFLLGQWLKGRREDERAGGNSFLPGQLTEEVYTRLCFLFPAFGFFIGFSAGLTFFTYTGAAPLNVFHYLAVFVFLQFIILLILACSLVVRASKSFPVPSHLSSLAAGFLIKVFQTAANRLFAQMPVEKRNSFHATLGIIKGKKHYTPLLFWPIFLLFQLFTIGFNVGLLAITLYKVTVTDIAFGWQSTIQFSAEAISHFVRILALPWSWCVSSPLAYPSLQEIEGSRIILKDGIYHLTTRDLVSWWPFLCFALLTYGLLPRIMFLLMGIYKKKRSMEKLQLDQAVFDRLLVRMQTPFVSTQAAPEPQIKQEIPKPAPIIEECPATSETRVQVLVPDDIFGRCPDSELIRILTSKGNALVKKIKIAEDYESDRKILIDLAASYINSDAILILMEAWMPPITDFMVFLQNLRTVLPRTTSIRVALLGRPGLDTIFTPVEPGDMKIWQQKIDSFGDPYLSIENLS